MLANRAVLVFAAGSVLAGLVAFGLALGWYYRRGRRLHATDGLDRRYYLDVAAVGGLLALVAGFFWRPLFEAGVSMPRGGGDLVSFFYPAHVFASQSLRAGEFPLWNPHLFGGMPFAADIQSGLFYPLNWLFWMPGSISYEKVEMLALVHYWLAASFSYALARSLGLGRFPGVLAGVLFAFSGFAVSHLGHLPMLAAAAWLPLVLLAVNQSARRERGGWHWAVASGLTLAISFLAGHFQLFLYNFYAAGLFWLAVAWGHRPSPSPESGPVHTTKKRREYWLRQAGRGGLAGLVMAGAVLVQAWPFYELGQLSVRSAISYEVSTQFGVWPIGLVELLVPDLFSPNPQEYFGYWSNTDVLGYTALFGYALAGLALLLPRAGRSNLYPVFFGGWAGAGLIFALSGFTIFQGWFFQFVPALNLTRGAGRFLVWFNLGLALAAATGLERWQHYRRASATPEGERVLRWGWRGLALAAAAIGLVPLPLLYAQVVATPAVINDLVVRAINGLVMAGLVLGLGAILLRLFYRRTIGGNGAAFLAVALVVFDLFSARADFNPQPGDVANGFYHDGSAAFLKQQDPAGQYRLDASVGSVSQAWQANTAQLYRLNDVRGVFNPLQLSSYETFWNGVTSTQKDFRAVPAYNLLGARYVITRNKEDPTGPQFKLAYQDSREGVKLNIFENSQALPLATLVHQTEIKPRGETLPLVLSPDFKPAQIAYLEQGRVLQGPAGPQPGEEVTLLRRSSNRLELKATVSSPAYVLINQAHYPGWQARLDGAEAPYERANYALGAVFLPPGQHSLTLEFAPLSFQAGLVVSLGTWLAALGFLVSALFPKRKPAPAAVEQEPIPAATEA